MQTSRFALMQRPRANGTGQECFNPEEGESSTKCRSMMLLLFADENPLKYFNYTYSLDLCRFDCMLAVSVAECGCLRPVDDRFLRDDVNVSFCSNKEMKVGDATRPCDRKRSCRNVCRRQWPTTDGSVTSLSAHPAARLRATSGSTRRR